MTKHFAAVLLLMTLPGCVAAIGNKGTAWREPPAAARPFLQERIDSARRIVELRQQQLDSLRSQQQSGRIDQTSVGEAEIALEEARIRLAEFRAEFQGIEENRPN